MDEPECSIENVSKPSQVSLKVLNKQLERLLRNESDRPDEELILKIIAHANESHSLREYIHLRYTNKLMYVLENFDVSYLVAEKIRVEVERVKNLLLHFVSDFSDFESLEKKAVKKLMNLNLEI